VVSEETAQISVAEDGRLARGVTAVQLRDIIAGGKPRATAEHPLLEIPG
jgi:hypothetical protein